ncbi:MAG: hypothetical protein KDE32_05750 [Novosphingobium sp.]|nr:hypothetical protein [Novosphingobium sp.]
MKTGTTRLAVVSAVALAMTANPALARNASTLSDLNGIRAGGAEAGLIDRGFKHISTNKNSMGYAYSYWWNEADKNCVQVEVYNGLVETIQDAKDSECGHTGGNAAAAAGVVAGAAILGALLAHKSNHHDNDQHYADIAAEQSYDRGYKDGLYNAPYHNYDKSDAYSSGYTAGVDERSANLSHHNGYGGSSQAAVYKDLNGARAAGGMDELASRGFVQVDNFTSGDTRYSIQYRAASRQCLQVTISDGHFYDVRDIGQHPKCR